MPTRLDNLPFEIREQIAQYCLQSDAFHLSLTCKVLYESTLRRLYQCIIFDSAHRHFNKELSKLKRKCIDCSPEYCSMDICANPSRFNTQENGWNDNGWNDIDSLSSSLYDLTTGNNDDNGSDPFISVCTVHTVGGLQGCLRTLIKSPEKAAMVQRLETQNSLEIPDLDVKQKFSKVFSNMCDLKCLVWHGTPELSIDLLQKLKNPGAITTLSLNLALRNDALSKSISQCSFPRLKQLELRPFRNSECLSWISQMLINSYSESMATGLKTLYLGQSMPSSLEVGSGFAFASMDTEDYTEASSRSSSSKTTCEAFFKPLLDAYPLNSNNWPLLRGMKKLGLDGILAGAHDLDYLVKAVDLSQLTHLCLIGSDDQEHPSLLSSTAAAAVDPMFAARGGFLMALAPYVKHIRHLELDWNNLDQANTNMNNVLLAGALSNQEGLPAAAMFLKNLTKLESLQLTIVNQTHFISHYIHSIVQMPYLKHLTIRISGPSSYSHSLDDPAISVLRQSTSLKSLRITGSGLPKWILNLHDLEYLHLDRKSIKPNLGQPYTLSYKLEDMERLEEEVRACKLLQPSLRYVKLEGYVFDVRGNKIRTREGLDQWLQNQMFPSWIM